MRTILLNEIKNEMPNSQALGAFNDSQSSGSGYNATLTSGASVKISDIYNDIKGINPNNSMVSSMGSFVSPLQQQMADEKRNEIINSLDKSSLAYKILEQSPRTLSDKQTGVIAYELNKNNEYKNKLGESKSNLANKAKDIRESKNSRKEFKKKKKMGINTTLPSNR